MSGVVANRYRIDRQIGQGGMATVYLAQDERHDSPVAVKVLRPELASRLGGERFVREIRITAQLQHPHILPVYDSGEWQGSSFYVMPFIEGETLEERLARSGPLAVEEAVSLAAEVADALAYAHARGFVHRDVKPSNIMLSHGHALLADFGIARAIDAAGGDRLTETGLAIGTAAYMSPEQTLGEPIDGRADIYALGCVLYEMLAGSPPFTGSQRIVMARHSADTAPSLRVVRDAVPESLERVIFRSMAKTPADRFADAGAFRDALRKAVTTGGSAAAPARSVQRTTLITALAAAAVTAAVIGGSMLLKAVGGGTGLDDNRVLMLPLAVSPGFEGPKSLGQDIATLILNGLDGAGRLQWIDGLAKLGPASRDSFQVPELDEARRMAREAGAAHFVTGSITPTGNGRVSVNLTLSETASGQSVSRAPAVELEVADAYRGGLRAANQLLSRLIGGGRDVSAEWLDREPAAIGSFLRAESEFRRLHYDEALSGYRDAFAADPTFGLAAIRGAQVAGWDHRPGEAAGLIEAALSLPLPERYADLARGYSAYLAGNADSALAAFDRVTRADPEMAEAWMQIGETWTHLLPAAGKPDSAALFAFETAMRTDPMARHLLLHIIEIRLRRGETHVVAPLLAEFMKAAPNTVTAAKLDIMSRCVEKGPTALDWANLVATKPFEVIDAGRSLSPGAAQPECAIAAYRAVLAIDTSATDAPASGRRWAATVGLQSLLLARGRVDEAMAVIDSVYSRWGTGTSLFLFDAILDDAMADRARAVMDNDRARFGPWSQWTSTIRLWEIGMLLAQQGDTIEAARIADEMARRATETPGGQHHLMGQSIRARIARASGNTAEERRLLEELVPAVVPNNDLVWDEFAPLAFERLALTRLLIDDREYVRAYDVASVFDSQASLIYTAFVRPSLELRLEAARQLGIPVLVSILEDRLARLDR